MKKNSVSRIFTRIGIMMFLTGCLWLTVNFVMDRSSSAAAEKTMIKLRELIPVQTDASMRIEASEQISALPQMDEPTDGNTAGQTENTDGSGSPQAAVMIPDYIAAPQWDMPVVTLDGVDYIAQLSIPSKKLDLPVAADWDYATLNIAPCRYYGSAYTHDLVISAHNYTRHFSVLRHLREGAEVILTDMQGNIFRYEVACLETIKPDAVEDMIASGFDLSLFTCSSDGTMRVCARCTLTESIPMVNPTLAAAG